MKKKFTAAQSAYYEKLKDPRWQKKRLEVFQRDEFMCRFCGAEDVTLTVHHLYYDKDADPWDYPAESLLTLCEECHQEEADTRYSCEQSLIAACRRFGMRNGDLIDLAAMFFYAKPMHVPDVVIGALDYFMRDPQRQQELLDRYFDYIKTNCGSRKLEIRH